jgi:hypothetical protein
MTSYVYHTDLDRMDIIEPGSVQHMGSNALAVVQEMANSVNIDSYDSSKMLYFDILGEYIILYIFYSIFC